MSFKPLLNCHLSVGLSLTYQFKTTALLPASPALARALFSSLSLCVSPSPFPSLYSPVFPSTCYPLTICISLCVLPVSCQHCEAWNLFLFYTPLKKIFPKRYVY